jgi:hypothetical protein
LYYSTFISFPPEKISINRQSDQWAGDAAQGFLGGLGGFARDYIGWE